MTSGLAAIARLPRRVFYLGVAWSLLVSIACGLLIASAPFEHVDFVAFYCAGESITHGADPYRQMPLNACEHRIASHDIYGSSPTAVPAPLPPYALVPIALLSHLTPAQAYLVFVLASLVALASGCVVLSRVTGSGIMLIVAAVAPAAWKDLSIGQPVPFVFLAIVGTGWALSRDRPRLAGAVAVATMIEPHVGLAVCATLFLWQPRTRGVLTVGAIVLALLSCIAVSAPVATAYLTTVLPLQAASEAFWINQLSLTKVLVSLGVPEHAALSLAFAQYAIAVVAAILAARLVARRYGAPEALAFLPPLFAAIGGTYVHSSLLLVALPAAVFVTRRRGNALSYLALAMVAGYWLAIADHIELLVTAASVCTIVYLWQSRVRGALLAAALVAIIGISYEKRQPTYGPPPLTSFPPTAYAEESWAAFASAVNPPIEGQLAALSMKIPTWIGLLSFVGLSVSMARHRPRRAMGKNGVRVVQDHGPVHHLPVAP